MNRIPKDVMNAYIASIIAYLETSEIMSPAEIEKYIADNAGTAAGE